MSITAGSFCCAAVWFLAWQYQFGLHGAWAFIIGRFVLFFFYGARFKGTAAESSLFLSLAPQLNYDCRILTCIIHRDGWYILLRDHAAWLELRCYLFVLKMRVLWTSCNICFVKWDPSCHRLLSYNYMHPGCCLHEAMAMVFHQIIKLF